MGAELTARRREVHRNPGARTLVCARRHPAVRSSTAFHVTPLYRSPPMGPDHFEGIGKFSGFFLFFEILLRYIYLYIKF